MTPEEIAKYVDHAAKQSDRYLFVVMLAIIIVGGGVCLWFLVRWLKELVTQLREDGKNFAAVVNENTKAFSAQREAFNELSTEVRKHG